MSEWLDKCPKSWKVCRLDEVAEVIDSLHKTPNYSTNGYPMVRVADIRDGFLDLSNSFFVTGPIYEEFTRRRKPEKGDIVFSRVGTYGNASYVATDENFCLGQNTALIHPRQILNRFLHYCLLSPVAKYQIESSVVGSTQKTISLKSISALQIPVPPPPEQKVIAAILSALDDKIELNRQMNETLEAMARAIFKDWFVDFGPTRAKQDGLPAYLPEHLWSLFPSAIAPETGLPGGWEEITISQYLDVKRGGSPRPIKDYIVPVGIPWVKIADATSINSPFIFSTKEFIKPEGLRNTVKLKAGSLILSNSATPGLPRFLMLDACIHDGWLYFPKIDKFSKEYLYLLFLSIRENLVGQGNGSIFTNLKTEIIKNQKIVDPSQTIIDLFQSSVSRFFEKMLITDNESRTLAELRDRLLPKLMSGEIRVKDAEKMVEEVM